MKLSKSQRLIFWRTFVMAAQVQGISEEAKDGWRMEIILRTTGRESLTEVARTGEFDALMYELGRLAQDAEVCGKFVNGDAQRLAHRVWENVKAILKMHSPGHIFENAITGYIHGILTRRGSGLQNREKENWWQDLSLPALISLNQITGSAVARLERKRGIR